MKDNPRKVRGGYIAIVSAIIVSTILILLVLAEGTSTFWSRYDQLDLENYSKSKSSATSCVFVALLDYQKASATPDVNKKVTIDPNDPNSSCVIDSVIVTSDKITVTTHAIIQHTYASMLAIASISLSEGILTITSWRDITSIPP